jgi:phosphoglycerate dehydrogenase-like enzyme
MRIVFHGENAASFSAGFGDLLGRQADVVVVPDVLSAQQDRDAYAAADVIIGVRFDASLPRPERLRLFHVPGAGTEAIDLAALPATAVLCNCFGHEQAIAEYVMAAILGRHVPLADADARLRRGDWAYWAGAPDRVHDELADKTVGLLGYGHIGQAVAVRAKAFEMNVTVANRSPVPTSAVVDQSFLLDELAGFWRSADVFVISLPLTTETAAIVGRDAFAAMRRTAVVINVGRGPTIDETALYEALKGGRIAGAIIDTWYRYPLPGKPGVLPSALPFHELGNIVMTPHMSGWTNGTIRRRQRTMAENVRRRAMGQRCLNEVRR